MLWRHKQVFHTDPLPVSQWPELNKTQAKVEGFDLDAYQRTRVCLIGAGGLGTHISAALIRQGIGELAIIDDDLLEPANLTRQVLFDRSDIGKYKSVRLARHLAHEGLFRTKITAQPFRFIELVERGQVGMPDLLIAAVDNNPTRRAVTMYGLAHAIRVIHVGVGRDADGISVMVQEPGKACWACAFPHSLDDQSYPCAVPGIVDVLQVAAGVVVFSIASLLSGRVREWTARSISLSGGMPDTGRLIERNPSCPLCGNAAEAARAAEPIAAPQHWWSSRSA